MTRIRGGGLSRKAIFRGLGIFLLAGLPAQAIGGHGRDPDGFHGWGTYGRGPHFFRRGTMRGEFGPPLFTHPMVYGARYPGPPPTFAPPTFGNFDAYTGVTPFPDTIAPNGSMLYGTPGRVAEPSAGADLSIPVPAPLGQP